MNKVSKLMLSVQELQQELGISKSLVYQLVRRTDFPTIRIGKRILIPFEEFKIWIRNNSIN